MTTFTPEQQKEHRKAFISECKQKAWSAACHADFVAVSLDRVTADYQKLKDEDAKLETEIKALELAVDSHTRENRDKRKAMQERRTIVAKGMQFLQLNMQQGQQAMQNLYQSIESNLALAKHAEIWGWKEIENTSN